MAVVRWDSVADLAGMEIDRLNHMFSDLYRGGLGDWVPRVDIYETADHEVVIKADLPEMTREDIDVTFENSVLTVKGERKLDPAIAREAFQRAERPHGSFSRSFTLPATVDAARISASYKDGVLTIRMPQREEAKPKQVAIQ